MKLISEIQIIPIKPNNGLVAFCSFVLYESFYCGSIAIMTRPNGSFRLLYPNKKLLEKSIDLFYPINKVVGDSIEEEVIKIFKDVMNYDRHDCLNNL
jgi:stage V sporulation protein G